MGWDMSDFLIAGGLLGGAAVTFGLAAWKVRNLFYLAGLGVALLALLALIWVTGAVGIIGTPQDDSNLLYYGVAGVAVLGALTARMRAGGMAQAMIATGFAQGAVGVVAIGAGLGAAAPLWPQDIMRGTAVFCALWILSGVLFAVGAWRDGPAALGGTLPDDQ